MSKPWRERAEKVLIQLSIFIQWSINIFNVSVAWNVQQQQTLEGKGNIQKWGDPEFLFPNKSVSGIERERVQAANASSIIWLSQVPNQLIQPREAYQFITIDIS